MKVLKLGFWWLLVPVTALFLLLCLLLFTTPGARFAAAITEQFLTELEIRGVEGNIAFGLSAQQVVWTQPEVTVTLEGFASWWEPRCLLQATICVRSLAAGRLHIDVPVDDNEADDTGDAVTPIDLPLLLLPWRLQIEKFYLAELDIQAGGRLTRIAPVTLAAEWQGKRVVLDRLDAAMNDAEIGELSAQLSGAIEMASEWPFNLVLSADYVPPVTDWQKQQLTLSGEGNIRNLLLKGQLGATLAVPDMEPLQLSASVITQDLDTDLQLQSLQGQWQGAPLQARGNAHFSREGELRLKKLRLNWGKNQATLNGRLQQQWDVQAALALLEPQLLAPEAQGTLNGQLQITGKPGDPLLNLVLDSDSLTLPDLELQNLNLRASISPVSLSSLDASATAGVVRYGQEQWQDVALSLQGEASEHRISVQAKRGNQEVQMSANGILAVDSYDWQGTVESLRLQLDQNWQVTLEQPIQMQWQQQAQRIHWQLGCLVDHTSRVCSQGYADLKKSRGDIQLEASQFDLEKLNFFLEKGTALQGMLNARLHLREEFLSPDLRGEITVQDFRLRMPDSRRPLVEHASMKAVFNRREAEITARFNAPPDLAWQSAAPVQISWNASSLQAQHHCWHAGRIESEQFDAANLGSLCMELELTDKEGLLANADLDLALTSALQVLLPEDLQINGKLTGHASVKAQGQSTQAEFWLTTHDAEVRLLREDDQMSLVAPIEKFYFKGELRDESVHTELELQSAVLGNAVASAQMDVRGDNPQLSLTASLQGLNVALAQPLVPQVSDLAGFIDARLRMQGALSAPDINGEILIRDVLAQSTDVPVDIDGLNARLVFDGNHGELDGLIKSGKGSAKLSGDFSRETGHWQARINLNGKNIPVVQLPDMRFMVHPDLTLTADAQGLNLKGTVLVNDGFLVLKELPPDAIEPSADVEYLDSRRVRASEGSDIPFGLNVVAKVEPSLRIRGFGAEVRLRGSVRAGFGTGGLLTGRGTINIDEGSYTGYGQQLNIRKGQAIFNGPLVEPYINLEAVRQVDVVVAGIRVQGPASEPIATLFSEPTMSDSQILYYIITGRAPDAAAENDNTAVRNALLSLGLMGGQPKARDIASKVGIDDLQLGTSGSGDSTAVTLSGYLNSRTYLQYGISVFEPVNTLLVRYRLRDNLFLEAMNGVASALDLLYSFEFGQRKKGTADP